MKISIRLLVNIVLIVIAFIPILFIGYRIVITYPENHWGFEIQWFNMLYIVNIAICIAELIFGVKQQMKFVNLSVYVLLVTSIIAIVALIFIEEFNILVEYDRWLKKGLPNSFDFR